MITFYKCTAREKNDLSYYKHSVKHKTNMGQPHYNQRPRGNKTNSLASSFCPTSRLSGPGSRGL